jgi:hypothetical protein
MSSGFSGRAFETRLNVLLGRILSSELGLRAISECISRRDRPDIVVYLNGVKVVLEGLIQGRMRKTTLGLGLRRGLEI